jgi:transcription termination/antitermination protein NusA
MAMEFARVIEQVSKEKGISKEIVIKAIEDSIKSAARKQEGMQLNIEAQYNADIGAVEVFKIWSVVETVEDPFTQITVEDARQRFDPEAEPGDEFLEKMEKEYGRIAAQAAKQNLVQRIRDAEREIIFNEFKDRKEEILTGIVTRFERKNMIVQLRPNVDAILPEKEQIPRERYRPQDRIRAFVLDVDMTIKGPSIVLSRTHPGFLKKLFEQEVPEIYEGIVEIKGVAREPGGRAKIADVDPVGACVGMKGTRVQSVVQELRGEKIDIVPWTPDPAEFVCRALAPAKVAKIIMDEDDRVMEVIVPDDQLSLAIGKKGQNVRLASRLSGWRLDVRSEGEAEDEARRARASLIAIPGIGDVTAELLLQEGYKTAEEVASSDVESLCDVEGVDAARAEQILAAASDHVAMMRQAEAAAVAAQAEAEAARIRSMFDGLPGAEEGSADKLLAAGIDTLEKVSNAAVAELAQALSLDKEGAERVRAAARAHMDAATLVLEGDQPLQEGNEA